MKNVEYVVYGRRSPPCQYCTAAIELLKLKGLTYIYYDVSDPDVHAFVIMQGWKTVPQIELWYYDKDVGGDSIKHIGGYSELKQWLTDVHSSQP